MATGPFPVGGDPIVHPADFRVTTFASGLNYPHGMMTMTDGSLLVGVSNPVAGDTSYYNTTGQLLRFTDADGDGVADGAGTSVYNGLPGVVTAVHQGGPFIFVTSSEPGSERISVLHTGATPADQLTLVGSLNFNFPDGWEHTTYASAVRPTPGQSGDYDLFFNIGSQFNGVVIGSDGKVVLDSSGNPTYQPTTGTVSTSGLLTATLNGDSIYKVTVHDNGGAPVLSNLTQIATGLRNAASLVIDPNTGDLWLADNGIDGNDGGNEAWSTDELDKIPAAQIGGSIENFGFPYSYTKTIDKPGDPVTVVNPGPNVIQPIIAYEPLPDSVLTQEGSESEGSSGIALSPALFPAGLNHGVFVGFHGLFVEGGIANDENPFVFADPSTGKYFDFISNNEANIGHLDEALSTADSLFIADISSTGSVFGSDGPGMGVIYQVKAINHAPVLQSIADKTVARDQTLTFQVVATDQDAGQTLQYALGSGAPAGAKIDAKTGVFTWTPDASTDLGAYTISVVVTDNGSPSLSGSQSFTVNVLAAPPVNHPPVIAAIPNQSVTQNQTLSLSIASFTTDSDIPAQTLHYSLGADAPAGVSLNSSTGLLTWTPSTGQAAGTYPITVNATDDGNPAKTGTRTFFVKVVAAPVDKAPVIQSVKTQFTLRGFTITLKFSEDLDPATATNVDNYILRMPGRDRRWGTGDDKIVPVMAFYIASSRTVTLTTVGRLNLLISLFTPFQLTVLGNSPGNVTGANGKLLDGNNDGQPGGNYTTALSRGGFFFGRPMHVGNLFPKFRQSGRFANVFDLNVPAGPEAFFKSRHSRP